VNAVATMTGGCMVMVVRVNQTCCQQTSTDPRDRVSQGHPLHWSTWTNLTTMTGIGMVKVVKMVRVDHRLVNISARSAR
jgi:hypothetical protein